MISWFYKRYTLSNKMLLFTNTKLTPKFLSSTTVSRYSRFIRPNRSWKKTRTSKRSSYSLEITSRSLPQSISLWQRHPPCESITVHLLAQIVEKWCLLRVIWHRVYTLRMCGGEIHMHGDKCTWGKIYTRIRTRGQLCGIYIYTYTHTCVCVYV